MSLMRTHFQRHLFPGLKEVIIGAYEEIPLQFPTVFRVESSNSAFEEEQSMAGLGLFSVVPEGTEPNEDRFYDGFHKRYNHLDYGLIIGFSWQAQRDMKTRLFGMRARELGHSARATRETVHAGVYNLAFSPTAPGPDGQPLCSTAHVNIRGGTQSNIISPVGTVSVTTVRRMLTHGRKFFDHTGVRRIRFMWEWLVVPPDEEFAAEEVLKSAMRPDTANNADNVVRNRLKVFTYDYLDDPNNFFMLARKSQHHIKVFEREKFNLREFEDERKRMNYVAAAYADSSGFSDWLGIVGSNPA